MIIDNLRADYLLPLVFGARQADAALASKVLQLLPPRQRGLSGQVDLFELGLNAEQLAGLGSASVVQAVLEFFDDFSDALDGQADGDALPSDHPGKIVVSVNWLLRAGSRCRRNSPLTSSVGSRG